jgi:hypothetical protein
MYNVASATVDGGDDSLLDGKGERFGHDGWESGLYLTVTWTLCGGTVFLIISKYDCNFPC